MKFAVAVVMLAFAAIGVQSSIIAHHAPAVSYVTSAVHAAPHAAWGPAHGAWGHGAWDGAWGTGHGAWGAPWGGHWGAPAAVAVNHLGYGHGWAGYPGISLSQGPHGAAPLAHDLHGHGHGHEGVYVAKTRGAIHTAPLAGHINSATSLNVAPAPGTH